MPTSVDIETRTTPRKEYPEITHQIRKFGLTVLAPITHIAFYEKGQEAIVLDMQDWDPWLGLRGDESKWQLIREKLTHTDLIIGHNVVFDLRHLLAHCNYWFPNAERWEIPLGVKVWDTMVIAQRMLLGEQASDRSPYGDSFGLAGGYDKKGKPYYGIAERFKLIEPHSDFWEFYVWMKSQRDHLSELAAQLRELDENHAVWTFLGGWIPPNRADLLQKAADKLLTEYVTRDTILSYELYEFELRAAQMLATQDFKWEHLYIPKWAELTQRDIHPDFESLLDFWTRRLRLNANRAGRGLLVNQRHIDEQTAQAQKLVKAKRKEVLAKEDKHDPYPNFERVFSMIMYYHQVLHVMKYSSSYNNPKNWAFWEPIKISPIVLDDALSDVPGKQMWIDWLLHLQGTEFTNKNQVQQAAPSTMIPEIDLQDWVRRNCYIGYEEPLASFLASVKCNWLTYYYKQKDSSLKQKARKYIEEHPDKADVDLLKLGSDLFKKGFPNSRIWIAYYMFCVATAPLPTHEEFKFVQELTTGKFKRELSLYRKVQGDEPPDFQAFAIQHNGLSYGKNAMRYFLESEHYAVPDLDPLRELMQAKADLAKFREFEQHAALDGAVHSIIINDTKSGRASSNNPNLQNVKMSSKPWEPPSPFPGTFMAPEGMWLTEWDYSNAEVRMGNMIGGDDAAAAATEGHDRHSALAEIYIGSEAWAQMSPEERKKWRNEYKRVTFGSEYGAGDYKIALMIKSTIERAREIMNNKRHAFYRIEEQKRKVSENAEKRLAAGCVPVFVSLWDRSRGQVDRYRKGCAGYTGWNTMQQGGVTAMISRADVLISEMLEREGYNTFVQQDVHDSLIIAFDIAEFYADDFALPIRIAQIMGSIMPDEYCERTSPRTHFVTNLGPENAKKWGYNPYQNYPLPLDKFINQWGAFHLPEGEKEAPTWIGPEHEGWTLAQESQTITLRKQFQAALDKSDGVLAGVNLDDGQMWLDLQMLLASHPAPDTTVLRLQQPLALVYADKNGQPVNAGHFPFAAWMAAGRILFHNGNGHLYAEMIARIQQIIQSCPEHFRSWTDQYATILEVR